MICYVMPCDVMICSCYVMLCHVMLCDVCMYEWKYMYMYVCITRIERNIRIQTFETGNIRVPFLFLFFFHLFSLQI